MDKREIDFDLVDQYREGSLTDKQRTEIERQLKENPEFAAEFDRHNLMIDGIRFSGRKTLKRKLDAWDLELDEVSDEPERHKIKPAFRWYSIAAAIAFFILAGMVINAILPSSNERIVADVYQPYEYIPQTTRGEKGDENANEEIFEYYDHKEYAKTIELLAVLDESQQTVLSDFIFANSYQAIGDYSEAILLYEKIAEGNTIYSSSAKWYLSLCHLSQQNTELAKSLLLELAESKSSYSEKAKEVLEELD